MFCALVFEVFDVALQTPCEASFTRSLRFRATQLMAVFVMCMPSGVKYPSFTLPSRRVKDGVLSANFMTQLLQEHLFMQDEWRDRADCR